MCSGFEMNSNPAKWFYPTQVFAQFTSSCDQPVGVEESTRNNFKSTSNDTNINTPGIIQIFETGEMTLAPDYAQVIIICTNTKDTVEEVKLSVNKRVEYILQTFRSHNLGKSFYTVDRSLTQQELKYQLRVELSIRFTDFKKCQEVSNFLVEKLDNSVHISRPSFHYAPGKLESLRRQSCVLAVHNARVKALEIANSLNQGLGQARHIHEESIEEYTGRELAARPTDQTETFQKLVKAATVTIITKVFVAFELKMKTKKKAK